MKMIALLRGINVGGNRKVPMPRLCKRVADAGFRDVQSYLQSGNLIFEGDKMKAGEVTALLERLIEEHFGFQVDVVVRTAAQWVKYSSKSPFPEAERERPSLLLLGLCKDHCAKGPIEKLSDRATQGEKIKVIGDAIWVDFAKSVGISKLTPAAFDQAAGSKVTMRNWNTVLRLRRMLEG